MLPVLPKFSRETRRPFDCLCPVEQKGIDRSYLAKSVFWMRIHGLNAVFWMRKSQLEF